MNTNTTLVRAQALYRSHYGTFVRVVDVPRLAILNFTADYKLSALVGQASRGFWIRDVVEGAQQHTLLIQFADAVSLEELTRVGSGWTKME